jgi:hypothetical protein
VAISISSSDGRTWRVSRRRLPWRPVVRDIDALDRHSSPKVTFVEYLLHGPIFWVLYPVVLVFRFLLTYGIYLTEWLLVLTLIPAAFAIRAAFPVPWPVYATARAPDGSAVRYTGVARGRDGTERLIDAVAAEIAGSGVPSSLELVESSEPDFSRRA